MRRPDLVTQLVFVAGVFHYDGWWPKVIDPNNAPPAFLEASYAELSPDGPAHYPVVVEKLAQLHQVAPTLTSNDLSAISCRTLVMIGDDDEVRIEHATALYRALPTAELAIVPGTSHGLLVEKADLCNLMIIDFLQNEATPTFGPIRRAPKR